MGKISNFAIIGGDLRLAVAAESLCKDGHTVCAVGFEIAQFREKIRKTNVEDAAKNSDVLILPTSVFEDENRLNAPFSSGKIYLTREVLEYFVGKTVICGGLKIAKDEDVWRRINPTIYVDRDDFSIKNAIPTAEGAIELAMREHPKTLHGSRCLVAGFGRVGRALTVKLLALGANVTISARKAADFAWIETLSAEPLHTENLASAGPFNMVFNTVPQKIFTKEVIENFAPGTLLIDLASAPGGVDLESAQKLGVKCLIALGLPGKVAPETAGEIVKQTVYNILDGKK